MESEFQEPANRPPPKPWEQAGSSSSPTPFKPPSSGSTSDVVEASGTAKPGEIVSAADRNMTVNRNALGRPVPAGPREQQSYNNTYGGYGSGLNYNSGYGSGMYGSYSGFGGPYGGGCMETTFIEEVMVGYMVLACMVGECTMVVSGDLWEVHTVIRIQIIHLVLRHLHQDFGFPSCVWLPRFRTFNFSPLPLRKPDFSDTKGKEEYLESSPILVDVD